MKASQRPRRIESWPIDRLTPHPQQGQLFADLSDAELQLLAEDLTKNGLLHAVEILTDGTIIAGHQRVAAARLLGWNTIRCWVRVDLEQRGERDVEARLIEDNLNRRQLSPLGVARCYVRLKALERDGWHASEDARGDLRDHLAARFRVDGRTLDRYARMLDAPIEVQHAFERGDLTQSQVLAVVRLDAEQQQEIAGRLRACEEPNLVVTEFVNGRRPVTSPLTAAGRFVRTLERAMPDVKRQYKRIKGHNWEDALPVLAEAEAFISALRRHLEKQNEQTKRRLAECVRDRTE